MFLRLRTDHALTNFHLISSLTLLSPFWLLWHFSQCKAQLLDQPHALHNDCWHFSLLISSSHYGIVSYTSASQSPFINLCINLWHLLCCSPLHSDNKEFWAPAMLCFSLYPHPCFHMLPWHKCLSPVFDPTDQWLFICQWSCLRSSSHVQWHDTWQYYPSFFQISCQNLFPSKTATDILKPEWPKYTVPFGLLRELQPCISSFCC